MNRALAGRVVTGFESAYAHVAAAAVDRPVVGRTVEAVRSVGKHLLIEFSGDLALRTHMRMSGSWHLYRPGERWQRPRGQMRVLIETADFVAVGFEIPVAELLPAEELARGRELGRLGPDLLDPALDRAEALRRMRAAGTREMGEVVLDQSVVAGAGNIFKSEVLFLCGVSPFAPAASVPDERLEAVVDTARRLLAANVAPGAGGGGIVTYRGLRRGGPTDGLWVYGRARKPCRKCGTAIGVRRQGVNARLTYYCPRCQGT